MNPLERLHALLAEMQPLLDKVLLGHDTDEPMTRDELDRTYPSTWRSDYPHIAAVPPQ